MDTWEKYFFDIPIYSCTEKVFYDHLRDKVKKIINNNSPYLNNDADSFKRIFNNLYEHYRYEWDFNEIIGWIRLFTLGHQIRGELYRITSKKIRIGNSKKEFENIGKEFEIHIDNNLSSKEIYKLISDRLLSIQKEKKYKKRFIYFDEFFIIGNYVNWRQLVDDSIKIYSNPLPKDFRGN